MQATRHGAVLWLTGLSGAGKSTLATAAAECLRQEGITVEVVDGDALRSGPNRDLGFTLADRSVHARRASGLAMTLAARGTVVIVALISPLRSDRAASANRIRARGFAFAEVFVNAPLSECERRDPKGLYRLARDGGLPDFTGIDSPYEPPVQPDLEIRTDRESAAESAARLVSLALALLGQ